MVLIKTFPNALLMKFGCVELTDEEKGKTSLRDGVKMA